MYKWSQLSVIKDMLELLGQCQKVFIMKQDNAESPIPSNWTLHSNYRQELHQTTVRLADWWYAITRIWYICKIQGSKFVNFRMCHFVQLPLISHWWMRMECYFDLGIRCFTTTNWWVLITIMYFSLGIIIISTIFLHVYRSLHKKHKNCTVTVLHLL